MMKKVLIGIGLTFVLGFTIYYFLIRERYLNNIHTIIDLNAFSEDSDGIENLINWYYQNYHIPAISAAIIEDGKVVKYISKGRYSKQVKIDVDENSYYQIASTSKTLTGIICKSLEIEGKLDLDKSISEYLSEKLSQETIEKFKDVSLRQVINHRSGLGRSMYAYSEEDIIKALTEVDLEFVADTKWQYSNFGYALVALILEEHTNKTYGELLKEYISDKYNLPNFKVNVSEIPSNQLVTPYWKHFRLLEGETSDFGIQVAASGVFANTKTLAALMVKQIEAYNSFDSLKNSSPLILNYPKAETWDEKNFYGYGLFEFNYEIDEIPGIVHKNLEHGGDADGFSCIYDFFPEYKTGLVVQTSSGGKWISEMTRHMSTILLKRNAIRN